MTNDAALKIYDEFFGENNGGLASSSPSYDDDDRADMVRAVSEMLIVDTIDDAIHIISWWGNTKRNRELCIAMRAKYDSNGQEK